MKVLGVPKPILQRSKLSFTSRASAEACVLPTQHSGAPRPDPLSGAGPVRNADTFTGGRWRGGALRHWSPAPRISSIKAVTFRHPQEQAGSRDGQGTTKIAAFTLIPTREELVVPGQIRMTLQDENDQ